jgi:hypothetical protein
MKKSALCALALTLAAPAFAQTTQTLSWPGTPSPTGMASPPSTLRITETPAPATAAPAAVRDTPESLREYERCRMVSDRAAVSRAQMQSGVAQCLKELEARRRAQ